MSSKIVIFLSLTNFFLSSLVNAHLHLEWDANNPAFDQSFYDEALDSELCEEQISYIARNSTLMRFQFLESGMRVPRSLLLGNTHDLGNYHQCLGINGENDLAIEGKYCTIRVPVNLDMENLPEIPEWIDFDPRKLHMDQETIDHLQKYNDMNAGVRALIGAGNERTRSTSGVEYTLAVCVPKTCTTQEGISGLIFNLTAIGFRYEDNFCRLNNDKPWVPADYVAVIIFSLIGLLTLVSTSYDLWHSFIITTDSKSISTIGRSFSLYTNTRRLLTFHSNPGALECVDGIRALAMMWVIIGHTFSTLPPIVNALDSFDWMISLGSMWITAAPISVDTFFMLSGLLVVYTTAGKLTRMKLLKNLHLFYLNRLLRMFPLLAAAVLAQASVFNRAADGPLWDIVAHNTNACRKYWWSTLLYVQNFVNTENMCLAHTWYLAIDIHLHILSPLILFWVLGGNRKAAWIAMLAGLLSFLTGATVYNFIMEFPGAVIQPARSPEYMYYMVYYYLNTLTRASPFFVGMIFGYLLHLWRGKKLEISIGSVALLWVCALIFISMGIYGNEPMKSLSWDNQTVDSLVNSFMRPVWAAGIGLLIFACVQGYGGPINWFLSLQMWKLPSRLSYGMYLFHYPIMFMVSGTALAPIFYSQIDTVNLFLSHFVIAILVSFMMTLIVDAPFSTLFKILLGGGPKKPQKEVTDETLKHDCKPSNGKLNGEIIANGRESNTNKDTNYSIKM